MLHHIIHQSLLGHCESPLIISKQQQQLSQQLNRWIIEFEIGFRIKEGMPVDSGLK